MRRAVLAAITLAGCSFVHGKDNPEGGTVDGRLPTSDASAVAPKCHSGLPDIRLCLDFEDTNLGDDESGIAHSIALQQVTQMSRGTQGAALMGDRSSIDVSPSPSLDISPQLSIEMWVAPTTFPTPGTQGWFLQSAAQYAIGFDGDVPICSVTAPDQLHGASTRGAAVPQSKWTHVACVYDGTTLALYVDGSIEDCEPGGFPIATNINSGVQIGAGFTGGMDDVHIYASAMTATDVCQLATGGTGCKSACPPPLPN